MTVTQLCISLATDSLFTFGATVASAFEKVISSNLSKVESFRRFLDKKNSGSLPQDIRFLSDMTTYLLQSNDLHSNQEISSQRLKRLFLPSSYQSKPSKLFHQTLNDVYIACDMLYNQRVNACESIVRSMQIFSSTHEHSILTSYGILITSFVKFRQTCLRYLLNNLNNKPASKQETLLHQLVLFLQQEDLQEDVQIHVTNMLKKWKSSSTLEAEIDSSELDFQGYELGRTMLELLGFPIPVENIDDIVARQLVIEVAIILAALRQNKNPSSNKQSENTSITQDSPQLTQFEIRKSSKSLVEDVHSMIYSQRLQQVVKYLDILNSKAQHKRKIVATLLVLHRQMKRMKRFSRSSFQKSYFSDIDNDSPPLTVEEIKDRTITIQRMLLQDLSQEPQTDETQYAERVAALRTALNRDEIINSDQKIEMMLDNVSSMENSIVLANQDAMKLIRQILAMVWSD